MSEGVQSGDGNGCQVDHNLDISIQHSLLNRCGAFELDAIHFGQDTNSVEEQG